METVDFKGIKRRQKNGIAKKKKNIAKKSRKSYVLLFVRELLLSLN
jgi:hypothetical protein